MSSIEARIVRDIDRRATCALAAVLVLSFAAACGGDDVSVSGPSTSTGATSAAPTAITAVSGGGQSGAPGAAVASPFVVKVTSASGTAVSGATVTFAVTTGSGALSSATAVTDATGQATTLLTLGSGTGAVEVTATVSGTALKVTFGAVANGLVTSVACSATGASTLAPGQAVAPTTTGICVTGAGEYALVAYNTSTNPSSSAALAVLPSGTDPVATAALASRSPFANDPGGALATDPTLARSAYEAQLHARRAAEMRPLIPAARAWLADRSAPSTARRAVIPATVAVGSLVRLNANGNSPCASPDYRAARVQAVTSKAIIVADTLNPAGGFTTADYQSIAVTFDTLVDAVDRRNFGDPSDIDANGHVVLFFTSAVNSLTPRNSGSYVGGFFDSRDLFPTTTSNGLPGCAGSNVGEMFYLLVPDPSGMVNGNRFSKTFVSTVTVSTVAHEYEHLINSSRRLYVNTSAVDFEETWLDEGLAHIAEELYFYARSGLGPQRNLDVTALKRTAIATAAFNDGGIANFDRLETFLENPTRNSPYADNDSLATRGATWSFLRYAADQQTAAQETIWSRLVNSNTTGLANLRQVFGTDLSPRFRDWAIALLLDDVTGADTRYQMPSWNYRSIYGALASNGMYPLNTVALTSGTSRMVDIVGGGAAYLRFAVGDGKTGSVSWGTLPSTLQMTLVRLR